MEIRARTLVIVTLSVLLAGTFLLNACGVVPQTDATQANIEPAATHMPTLIPMPTVEERVDECLACHIDEEMLIDTADPVVEVVSENEGSG